jgi:hypothetical protein
MNNDQIDRKEFLFALIKYADESGSFNPHFYKSEMMVILNISEGEFNIIQKRLGDQYCYFVGPHEGKDRYAINVSECYKLKDMYDQEDLKNKNNKSITMKTGYIGAGAVILAAIIAGVFSIFGSGKPTTNIDNRGGSYIEKNTGNVSIVNNNGIRKKIAIVPIIKNEDIHLGDNVYPNKWGYDHNPLYSEISSQQAKGIVYFDKETGVFFAGLDGQTIISQSFVSDYSSRVAKYDFSAFKTVTAFQGEKRIPSYLESLINNKNNQAYVQIDPGTILYKNQDNKGNFYERAAAVAVVRSVSFTVPLAEADIDPSHEDIKSLICVLECYHGGLRQNQSQNFELNINGKIFVVNTSPNIKRKKEIISIPIDHKLIKFDSGNVVSFNVLPWVEDKPKNYSQKLKMTIGPAHFRDVGIINAFFKIEG